MQISELRSPFRRSRTACLVALTIIVLIYFTTYLRHQGQRYGSVQWTNFAYSQYATDSATLCNAVMVFEALHRLGSSAERLLLYPEQWDTSVENPLDRDSQLLNLATIKYGVKLHPIKLIGVDGEGQPGTFDNPQASWDTSITKLLAFNLTQYHRVLHLDSDITLLQHMDELFLLPRAPVAMPRAYWSNTNPGQAWPLTSLLVLLEPDPAELEYLLSTTNTTGGSDKYDMDILNTRFASSAMVLPHRPYALLSAEFRRKDHAAYLDLPPHPATASSLSSTSASSLSFLDPRWDPDTVLAEAKLVHFSDWPLPKPWIMWPSEGLAEMQPDCGGGHVSCRERVVWKKLYDDFRRRRKDICRILSVPAPDWENLKKGGS